MSYDDPIANIDFELRDIDARVDKTLARRWSPRAFTKTEVKQEDLKTLFEAARYAPSCFNEQPWEFYVSTENTFKDFLSLIVDANQAWAKDASLLCFMVARTTFKRNGKDNAYAEFDCGAAWMSLAYQARKLGLYTHAMGGISHERVFEYLGLDQTKKVICGIAIGAALPPEDMSDEVIEKEVPTGRNELSEVLFEVG